MTQRDLIAKKLKPGQVAEAQRLATDFKPAEGGRKAVASSFDPVPGPQSPIPALVPRSSLTHPLS